MNDIQKINVNISSIREQLSKLAHDVDQNNIKELLGNLNDTIEEHLGHTQDLCHMVNRMASIQSKSTSTIAVLQGFILTIDKFLSTGVFSFIYKQFKRKYQNGIINDIIEQESKTYE